MLNLRGGPRTTPRVMQRGAFGTAPVSTCERDGILHGSRECGSRRRVPDEPVPGDATGFRAANGGLRSAVEAKDAETSPSVSCGSMPQLLFLVARWDHGESIVGPAPGRFGIAPTLRRAC